MKDIQIDKSVFEAVPIIGINRHRLLTDGQGITSLVAFHGCPLRCAYCLNPQSLVESGIKRWITPKSLYEELVKDDIYFRSTGGGVCFGGGEPLLRSSFIKQFQKLCGGKWKLTIETSLNVPIEIVKDLTDVVDEYIIDIKDMSSPIYEKYTGKDNANVLANLQYLLTCVQRDRILVRVPTIPNFNKETDIETSIKKLSELGVQNFDRLKYITGNNRKIHKDSVNPNMPVGKAICEVLKRVRKTIAEANGIMYEPENCNHKGDCPGTCPKCEMELHNLSKELWQRENKGIIINI